MTQASRPGKSVKATIIDKFDYKTLEADQIKLWFAVKKWLREEKAKKTSEGSGALDEKKEDVSSLNAYVFQKRKDADGHESHDVHELASLIKELIDNGISYKFQFAYQDAEKRFTHYDFGEVEVDCSDKNNILVKILLDNPLFAHTTEYDHNKPTAALLEFIRDLKFDVSLLKKDNTKIEFYLPNTQLQHTTLGCTPISALGCIILSNQSEFTDIYKYMKKQDKTDLTDDANMKKIEKIAAVVSSESVIQAAPPARLFRLKFLVEGKKKEQGDDKDVEGLDNLYSKYPESKNEIVNKKGKTAPETQRSRWVKDSGMVVDTEEIHGKEKEGNFYVRHKIQEVKKNLQLFIEDSAVVGQPNNLQTKNKSDVETQMEAHSFAALKRNITKLVAEKNKSLGATSTGTVFKDLAAASGQEPSAIARPAEPVAKTGSTSTTTVSTITATTESKTVSVTTPNDAGNKKPGMNK